MKNVLWSISLIFSSLCCLAQDFTFNQGGLLVKSYYEELPYETINGKIIVSVELAGKKHRFLFDTGAPCAVSKALAAELNASVLHRDKVRDLNGNEDSATIIDLAEIKWGNLLFSHIPALTLVPDFYKCWSVEGVIGSNLLRNSIVYISGKKQLIILTDQADQLALNPAHSVPLITGTNRQSDPLIQISLKDNVPLTLGFDTGDEHFLRMSEELMNGLKKSGVFKTLAKGYGATSVGEFGLQKNADKYLLLFPVLTIGDARFEGVITATNKGGIPGIGSKLLDYGSVTLDFIHGRFYFDAISSDNDLSEKQWPFQPALIGDKLVVGVVWGKGVGEVKPGQQIVAVDGTACPQVSLCDMLKRGSLLAGKEAATMSIKDEQGSIKQVQIRKE